MHTYLNVWSPALAFNGTGCITLNCSSRVHTAVGCQFASVFSLFADDRIIMKFRNVRFNSCISCNVLSWAHTSVLFFSLVPDPISLSQSCCLNVLSFSLFLRLHNLNHLHHQCSWAHMIYGTPNVPLFYKFFFILLLFLCPC